MVKNLRVWKAHLLEEEETNKLLEGMGASAQTYPRFANQNIVFSNKNRTSSFRNAKELSNSFLNMFLVV